MIRLRQVELNIGFKEEELIAKCAKKLNIKISQINSYKIVKKSIDARDKNKIVYSYEIDIDCDCENQVLTRNKSNDILKAPNERYEFNIIKNKKFNFRPIIIGSGPCGLFAGYVLAKNGCKPLILERGEEIEKRIKKVEKFWNEGILDINTNVQFGEGGAGTFSDGKLNTLIKDKQFRKQKVLEIFVEAGAPKEILYQNKPHIGTDILRIVVKNLRNKIIEMGGEIRYNSCLTNLNIKNSKIQSIVVNNKETINTEVVILAIGHSARDTFKMLKESNIYMEPKAFGVGLRIQHSQKMINQSQYGKFAELLPPASYKLTFHASNGRGVYTFCMCPGGFVVNASSEKGYLAINGMSNFKRDTENANSAIVVTISPEDFKNELFRRAKTSKRVRKKIL